jgi:hypothetical protein
MDTRFVGVDGEVNAYATLVYDNGANEEFLKSAADKPFRKWEKFVSSVLKQENWSRLGHLAKSLHVLPEDVAMIFNRLEEKTNILIKEDTKLQYYQDFTRSALGSTTLHFREVESLVRKRNPHIRIGHSDFHTLVTSKLEQSVSSSKIYSENNKYFDFENFAALIYDLLQYHEETIRVQRTGWSVAELLSQLPLDPDSGFKQSWDILCLVFLLYCSFSVPYSIAFDDSVQGTNKDGMTAIQIFELCVDCTFMLDIALSFVTGYDNQGYVIRDFRTIARNYLLGWFLPDLAGSFPFDKVISAIIFSEKGANSSSVASTNLMRSLKLVRMLKLIRAVKFMNKLNKLKQQEGFEAFGSAISLGSALFALIFVAHILGCFFSIMTQFETGPNWLVKYRSFAPVLALRLPLS